MGAVSPAPAAFKKFRRDVFFIWFTFACHCEERSDVAISKIGFSLEIATTKGLAMT
jgi:hypothetical protein